MIYRLHKKQTKKLNIFFRLETITHIRSAHPLHTQYTNRMPQTTYRLFDGTTRVSTAVKCKNGSILMVYPRKEHFADIDLWKWVVEHEEDYVNSSLSLSTDSEFEPLTIRKPCPSSTQSPEPLSPYTPPLAPSKVDNSKLGPTTEDSGFDMDTSLTFTPRVSPRPEFQEPLPLAPVKSYHPCELRQTADGPGYDEDDEVHRKWLMAHELTHIQSDLASLAKTMNERLNLMDVRIKALIKKLD
jgi:hypothetical protein